MIYAEPISLVTTGEIKEIILARIKLLQENPATETTFMTQEFSTLLEKIRELEQSKIMNLCGV